MELDVLLLPRGKYVFAIQLISASETFLMRKFRCVFPRKLATDGELVEETFSAFGNCLRCQEEA